MNPIRVSKVRLGYAVRDWPQRCTFRKNKISDYAKENPLAFRMGSWNGAKPNLDGRTGHFRYNRHFWNTRNRLRLLPAASRALDEVEQIQNFSFVINLEFLD